MPTATNYDREKSEVAAILASGILNRAPSLAQLLTYICDRYFKGEASQIKEYNIAVEALGRPPDFDQTRDSIVRVEAHRLRKRLKEYYETTGADHTVRIVIPPGHYAPRFVLVNEPGGAAENGYVTPAKPELAAAESPRIPRIRLLLIAAAALAVLAAATPLRPWLLQMLPVTREGGNGGLDDPQPATGETLRILAGSTQGYTGRFGEFWQPDRYFTGGAEAGDPVHAIWGTRNPKIYQNRREGAFRYDIPLNPGSYELRLHFAELVYGETNIGGGGETSRIFHVKVNGVVRLEAVDVVAEAGPSTADVRVLKDVQPASDGCLHLEFEPLINSPILSAIEITPAEPGRLRPIRMVARDQPLRDRDGRQWDPDRFFRGGQLVTRPVAVKSAADPEIYRGERFGNINYAIPVAKGQYTLILHFAETWFGPDKPAKGGANSRLFDILCNGVALARNLDIYKEAGGADRELVKVFHNLEASPQGRLSLSFVPVKNYACINAIEVIDEAPPQARK